jgi:molybdopterin-guanine dinucleotide biosynthesis protein A
MEFSAVLLAGGRSLRMGSDKATLVVDGRPLWRRQIETLRDSGAAEIFVSGQRGIFGEIETLEDDVAEAGPLTGLIVSFRRARFPFVLVLAVDMPEMSATYLQKLVSFARPGMGVVPRRGEVFEPLAAVYPREALAVAEATRMKGERALQGFARSLVNAGFLLPFEVPEEEANFFVNMNTPADWAAASEKNC